MCFYWATSASSSRRTWKPSVESCNRGDFCFFSLPQNLELVISDPSSSAIRSTSSDGGDDLYTSRDWIRCRSVLLLHLSVHYFLSFLDAKERRERNQKHIKFYFSDMEEKSDTVYIRPQDKRFELIRLEINSSRIRGEEAIKSFVGRNEQRRC